MKLPELNYTTPKKFTPSQKFKLAVLPPVATTLLKGLLHTCRHEIRNGHHLSDTLTKHSHAIVALWHEAIPYALYNHAGLNYHAATSYSFDGELAARFARGFNVESLRGSSSRGGMALLRQMEKALTLVDCVGLTIDGPRGPRRQAQPGLAILSARSGVPVVPFAFATSRRWRLRTWDRMPLPKPFGKIICEYAPPIAPAPRVERAAVNAKSLEIQQALNRMHEVLEMELGDVQHEVHGQTQSGD